MEAFENLISSEELQKLRKQPQTIPQLRGRKENLVDFTDVEKHKPEIDDAISQHIGILKEERITRKGSLSTAIWNSQCSYAEVTIQKGSYWKQFGRIIEDKLTLNPEEALFLIDQGNLELYYGGIPISLQQVYSVLLPKAFPVGHYLIYTYLLRLGYMVVRHQKRNYLLKSAQTAADNEERKPPVKSCCDNVHSLCDEPLVQPRNATSTASVLSMLQVVKSYKLENDIQSSIGQSHTVDFDVYLPNSTFKKSDPGLPAFCISVCRSSDNPPSLAVLSYLTQQCQPVPLKFALIADGAITINSLLDVEVPTYARDK